MTCITTLLRRGLALATLVSGSLALAGCAPPPRPSVLDEARLALADDGVRQLATAQPRLVREARGLLAEAERRYSDREGLAAEMRAHMALQKLAAAENLTARDAAEQLTAAMAQARAELGSEYELLRREREELERFAAVSADLAATRGELERLDAVSQSAAAQARRDLFAARQRQSEAISAGAASAAPDSYGQGRALVEAAVGALDTGLYEESSAASRQAIEVFAQAVDASRGTAQARRQAEQERQGQASARSNERAEAQKAIQAAEVAQAEALALRLQERSPERYGRGEFMLRTAQRYLGEGDFKVARERALEAKQAFDDAKAQPLYAQQSAPAPQGFPFGAMLPMSYAPSAGSPAPAVAASGGGRDSRLAERADDSVVAMQLRMAEGLGRGEPALCPDAFREFESIVAMAEQRLLAKDFARALEFAVRAEERLTRCPSPATEGAAAGKTTPAAGATAAAAGKATTPRARATLGAAKPAAAAAPGRAALPAAGLGAGTTPPAAAKPDPAAARAADALEKAQVAAALAVRAGRPEADVKAARSLIDDARGWSERGEHAKAERLAKQAAALLEPSPAERRAAALAAARPTPAPGEPTPDPDRAPHTPGQPALSAPTTTQGTPLAETTRAGALSTPAAPAAPLSDAPPPGGADPLWTRSGEQVAARAAMESPTRAAAESADRGSAMEALRAVQEQLATARGRLGDDRRLAEPASLVADSGRWFAAAEYAQSRALAGKASRILLVLQVPAGAPTPTPTPTPLPAPGPTVAATTPAALAPADATGASGSGDEQQAARAAAVERDAASAALQSLVRARALRGRFSDRTDSGAFRSGEAFLAQAEASYGARDYRNASTLAQQAVSLFASVDPREASATMAEVSLAQHASPQPGAAATPVVAADGRRPGQGAVYVVAGRSDGGGGGAPASGPRATDGPWRAAYGAVIEALVERDRAEASARDHAGRERVARGSEYLRRARASWQANNYLAANQMAAAATQEFRRVQADAASAPASPPSAPALTPVAPAGDPAEASRRAAEQAAQREQATQRAEAALRQATVAAQLCDVQERCLRRDQADTLRARGLLGDARARRVEQRWEEAERLATEAHGVFQKVLEQQPDFELPPDVRAVRLDGDRIVLSPPVSFKPGGARLTPESAQALQELARALVANRERVVRLTIGGHTDSQGRPAMNRTLSDRRAQAVRTELIRRGVAPGLLVAKGFGADQPIADNASEAGRALNRRVELRLTLGAAAE